MAVETTTFASIKTQLTKGTPAPVYLLHGEEGYFIDEILKQAEAIIPEADRDFDFYMLYAPQQEPDTVMDVCRRYPMMSPRQVVILKEAQSKGVNYLKALKNYLENPSASTILLIAYRGEAFKSADVMNAVKKGDGCIFESKKLKDAAVSTSIQEYVKQAGLSVDPKALAMLTEFVGSDLSRLYNEINKLTVTLGTGAMITPEAVERNIGVSKDYNNFELASAVARRDFVRSMKIVDYYKKNPKNHAVQIITPTLFNLFSNLLIAQYAEDKSERGIMGALGFKWPGQMTDINQAMRNYRPAQVVNILSELRKFDAYSKGNGSRMDPYDLLKDLIYRIES